MDLGLTGKSALICASSQGLGLACARALAREGAAVTLNGRDAAKLAQVRAALAAEFPQAQIATIAADLTTEAGRAAILRQLPEADILVTNNAGPPPGGIEGWDEAALIGAFQANMMPAVQLARAYLPGDAGAALWPDRQHHLGHGQIAALHHGSVDRRACRSDRDHEGAEPRGRGR